MSASTVQVESTNKDLNLEFDFELRPTLPDIDPNIDDPGNDTGLAPSRGDLQMSDEFTCLLRMILKTSGESS